jgi:hypothetical protein
VEESSELRVSDQQREHAAEQLRDHFAAGRLSEDELSERVQAAYSARTDEQLRAPLADLPRLPVSPQQRKQELAQRRGQLQRRLIQETGGGLALFAVCVVVWAASGSHRGMFWPIWVALVTVLPLLRNGWRLYGPDPQLDRVERELESRERRAARRAARHARRRRPRP